MRLARVRHHLIGTADAWECSRCGLTCDAGHRATTEERWCSVPQVVGAGAEADAEDARHWRTTIGYFRVHTDWCKQRGLDVCTAPEGAQQAGDAQAPPEAGGPRNALQLLRPFRHHKPVWLNGLPCCVNCAGQPPRKEQAAHWLRGACPGPVRAQHLILTTRRALRRCLEEAGTHPERLAELTAASSEQASAG